MANDSEMTKRKNATLNRAISESDSDDPRPGVVGPTDLRIQDMAKTVTEYGNTVNDSAFNTIIPSQSMSGEDNAVGKSLDLDEYDGSTYQNEDSPSTIKSNMRGNIPREIFYINDKTGKLQIFKSFDELSEYLVEASGSTARANEGLVDDEIVSKMLAIPLGSMVHHMTIGKYLRHLYEKDKLMDVNVEVDTQMFKAHRIALACYSKYFADLFSSTKTSKSSLNLRIKGISEASFAAFLEFVYTGEVSITPEIAMDILIMAEYLKVPGLKKKFAKIVDILSLEHITKILTRSKEDHAFSLALGKAAREFVYLCEVESFLDVDTDLICRLLESDQLVIDSEYQLFLFIIRYIAHNLDERLKYAARMLGLVRFTCMTQIELFMCSEATALIRGYDKFREYLLIANWLATADKFNREDTFGFPREKPRLCFRNRFSDFRTCIDVYQGNENLKQLNIPPGDPADKEQNVDCMPAPLMTSTPRSIMPQNYAKPVMLPHDVKMTGEPFPKTVDILVIGGFQVDSSDQKERSVERYDIKDNEWVYYCQLQEPRRYHSVVNLDGKLYLLGGCDPKDDSVPTNTVYVMDLKTKEWTTVADMQDARKQHCACAYNGKVYVMGGKGLDDKVLNTVECYNPETDTWLYCAPLGISVYAAAAAVLHDRIFVAGGIMEPKEPFSKGDISPCVSSYNPLTDSWSFQNDLRFPRCRAEMVNVGDKLFLCGGATLACNRYASRLISLSSIDEYIPKHDMWCHLTDLIIPRHDIGVAVAGDRIYIVGGLSSTADRVLQSIECFDTKRYSWLSGVQDLPYPTQWLKCATVVPKWERVRRNSQ